MPDRIVESSLAWRFRLSRLSPLHRVADMRDHVTNLAACPTNRDLNLPHGLVNVTLSLKISLPVSVPTTSLTLPFA
jgi:hypothetical protein